VAPSRDVPTGQGEPPERKAIPTPDVSTSEGLAWLTRTILGYLEEHPGATEDVILTHTDDAAGDNYEGTGPSFRAVDLLCELVTEGTLRWAPQRGKGGRLDVPLRYWIARRTGDYACETKPSCLCSADKTGDECDCQRRSRAEVTSCRACGARMPEFAVTDHRAGRPFHGARLRYPRTAPLTSATAADERGS
jgi:hypothetical protein